jgi:5-methylcytosine-specific restriction endonuclease McrA
MINSKKAMRTLTEEHKRKISLAKKGKPSWHKGKHRSEETRKKMSIAKKGKPTGKKWSESQRKIIISKLLGHKVSDETRNKIRKSLTGKKHTIATIEKLRVINKERGISTELRKKMIENIPKGKDCWNWKGGKAKCIDCGKLTTGIDCKRCKDCFREWQRINPPKGNHQPFTEMHHLKLSQSHMRHFVSIETREKHRKNWLGSKHPNWKGGVTSFHHSLRNNIEFKQWRDEIFRRDNYTCQSCKIRGGKLHSHHIKPISIIMNEFLKEYSQFSPIEDKETLVRLAVTYKPFWEVDNGITYCKECHKKINHYILIPNMRNVNERLLAND